jgi:hypothetical protein
MSLFLAGRFIGVLFFGLPILDRIASPTAAVTKRLYSNLGVDLTPWPPIRRLSRTTRWRHRCFG